jgi:acyl dehydratase
MPLNRAFIGREYSFDTPFEVGRELIRHFASAIGDNNPICHDVEAAKAAGHRDLVAPPTFLTTLNFRRPSSPVLDPELGLDYSLVVHGEQKFVLHRPVYAGDALIGSTKVTDIRDIGRNEALITETNVFAADGEHVATATMTTISRGTAAPKEG